MTAVPLLLLAAALLAWSPAGARTSQRVRLLSAARRATPPPGAPDGHGRRAARQRWLLAGAAGGALGLLVGGLPGAGVAVAAAVAGERLLRRRTDDDGARRAAVARELPVTCDLLAVCLSAGVPVGAAVAAVADVVAEPLAGPLRAVGGLYRLGAEPRRAWSDAPPGLAALGRVLVRAGESGSTAGSALRALAADARAAARSRIESDVRRAGVWVLAPLGLCFLPAFVCLGVVPLVLGIAAQVFG